ncbi:MAG: 5-oxoprolinase subunit PxpA [Phycisphaerales bacterium]
MSSINTIDLNCDMGESDDELQIAIDAALMQSVTSINVACGGHAGNEASMERTVLAAMSKNVAIGAHPSYPDRENFGRVPVNISLSELENSVRTQIATLARICERNNVRLKHVKPHGALYHAAMTRNDIADVIACAVQSIDASLILVGLAGSQGLARWKSQRYRVAAEAFADRQYEHDGSLRSRQHADSLIVRTHEAVAQSVGITVRNAVVAVDGTEITLQADTLCIHSDTPNAVEHAKAIRAALERASVRVASLQ